MPATRKSAKNADVSKIEATVLPELTKILASFEIEHRQSAKAALLEAILQFAIASCPKEAHRSSAMRKQLRRAVGYGEKMLESLGLEGSHEAHSIAMAVRELCQRTNPALQNRDQEVRALLAELRQASEMQSSAPRRSAAPYDALRSLIACILQVAEWQLDRTALPQKQIANEIGFKPDRYPLLEFTKLILELACKAGNELTSTANLSAQQKAAAEKGLRRLQHLSYGALVPYLLEAIRVRKKNRARFFQTHKHRVRKNKRNKKVTT